MNKEEFNKKVKNFFSVLGTICMMILVGSITFVAGYMLGLNRIAVPYLSNYIKVPVDKAATNVSATTTPLKLDTAALLKTANPYSADAMTDKFKRFKFSPFNESRFNFTAVLPVDWSAVPPKMHLDTGSLMDNLNAHKDLQIALAQIDSPAAKTSGYQVWALNVPPDVDLDKFFRNYTSALNAELVADKPTSGGRKHVLIRYKTADGKQMLARGVAVRSGEYVFYLICTATEADFPKLSDMYNLAALSFSPEQGKDLEAFDTKLSESTGSAAVVE